MSQFILKDTFTFSNSQSYLIKINNKNRKQYNGLLITSLVAQTVKRLPTLQETRVQSLGWEDLLEKEMATHSSILVWKIPWMEEPDRLQSMRSGSQTRLSNFTLLHGKEGSSKSQK